MIPNLEIYLAALEGDSNNRCHLRAHWHDYRERSIYMVTIMKMPGIPPFSHISGSIQGKKVVAKAIPSRLGNHISRALRHIQEVHSNIRLLQYSIMPDHLHLLMEVTSAMEEHFGFIVREIKSECSNRYRTILKEESNFDFPYSIFTSGFNDRILKGRNQLPILFDYIRDNPRRLFLKQNFPEYFRNRLLCITPQEQYALYGNITLLENPTKFVVRFSRRYSEETLRRKEQEWDECIRSGGVLVSPFIHRKELEYEKKALEYGGKLIKVCNYGFPERWKPWKEFIDPCSEGRVLFVGKKDYSPVREELSREEAMRMNELAEKIAYTGIRDYSLRRY